MRTLTSNAPNLPALCFYLSRGLTSSSTGPNIDL